MPGRDKFTDSLNQIFELADSVAAPLGLCIVDVKFGQQGRRRTLEVTIHRKNGSVSLDDCEQVSRTLERTIDEHAGAHGPLVEGAYILEVQSPGIDRPLKSEREFRTFAGQRVLVQTKEKVSDLGSKFTATLIAVDDGKLTLAAAKSFEQGKKQEETTKDQVTLEIANLVQVKLHPELLKKAAKQN
ncbi:MAG TPA: ribosome maturation factor RimP [Trichormus sp.]